MNEVVLLLEHLNAKGKSVATAVTTLSPERTQDHRTSVMWHLSMLPPASICTV